MITSALKGGWVFKWRCAPIFNSFLSLGMSFFPKGGEGLLHTYKLKKGMDHMIISHKNNMLF